MRTVVITSPGDLDVLEVIERPTPTPAPGEVLVRVRAAGLNRADLLQRRGRYPPPPGVRVPPDVPGLEFAGEVAALGTGVADHRIGDRVFGLAAGGAHAEYLCAHAGTLSPVPPTLDWVQAAASPEAYITAFDAMVTQGELRAGERVLIHAVGSGVGLAAVQLAREIGAEAYGTSRTAEKLERAREHGMLDGAALSEPEQLSEHAPRWTRGRGFHLVLELVGGAYLPASLAALGDRGRLLLVGLVAGARADLDLRQILSRRLTIIGTVLRSRPLAEKIIVTRAFATHVVPLLAAGRLTPVIDSVFPADEVRAAHQRLEGNETFGKVVITF